MKKSEKISIMFKIKNILGLMKMISGNFHVGHIKPTLLHNFCKTS